MKKETAEEFRTFISQTAEDLTLISPEAAGQKMSEKKWSEKEILGHLIDSASNNHGRFVRACFKDDLIFQDYDQNHWVEIQNYRNSDWEKLIELWKQFNLHIANIIETIPAEIKTKEVINHNLHEIAWGKVSEDQPATLEYFMNDYIGHCRHHIGQILPHYY